LLKLAESETCKKIINDTQRNIGYRVVFLYLFEARQFFKRIFYLKKINVSPLGAEDLGQLPRFPPLIQPCSQGRAESGGISSLVL